MNEILVFYDFACPFCYIGFSIIEKLNREESVNIKWIPVILNPEEAMEGSDLGQHIPELDIQQGYERIESLADEYSLIYNNKRKKFNTNRLHEAALYAYEKNRYFEFAKLAYRYIFEFGKNIALFKNISEIATLVGLDVNDMNRTIDSGRYKEALVNAEKLANHYAVTSVPTFIVNGEKKPTTLKAYKEFKKDLLS